MVKRVLFVGAVVVALGVSTASPTFAAEPASYLAVIDAGSSGTRLTLFSDDQASLVPREVTRAKTNTPGLSSFTADPAQAGPGAVTPLLEQLDAYLTEQGIATADVPVALLATAGMRNVRRDDRVASQAILDSTAAAIAAAGYPVADNRILPAVQEATLAWLDANVLAGTLNKRQGSVGIVEIGGASAQVAFRSPVPKGPAVQQVRVDGQVIPVVAVSYLGLGGNDARALMQEANDAGSFCFPNNAGQQPPSTYVARSDRPVAASTANFSWDRCTSAFDTTVESVGKVRTAAATVAPSRLRQLPGFNAANFVGLGSLPFTFADFGVAEATNEKVALRRSATSTCTGEDAWTKVLGLFAGRSATFAETLCSNSAYSYEMLFGATGVGVDSQRFTVDDAAFPRSPAWTSGYAITVLDP